MRYIRILYNHVCMLLYGWVGRMYEWGYVGGCMDGLVECMSGAMWVYGWAARLERKRGGE